MKYIVTMRVEGRIDIEVQANSADEAFEKARGRFADADLSKMDLVDGEPVNCTDEDSVTTDY